MKQRIWKTIALGSALAMLLSFPTGKVHAVDQGTKGNELQLMEPEQLEIDLGKEWAGVGFTLETEAGLYPGTILVEADGVLRLEIGGSSQYRLELVEAPQEEETQESPTEVSLPEETAIHETAPTEQDTILSTVEQDAVQIQAHLILFGCGMVVAVGAWCILRFLQKKRTGELTDLEDEW